MTRVGLDARSLGATAKSGVETYVCSLVAGLNEQKTENFRFYFFVDERFQARGFPEGAGRIVKIPFISERKFWWLVKLYCYIWRIDLFHFTSGVIPPRFPSRTALSIYDLTYEYYPEFYQPKELELLRTKVKGSIETADGIITISQSTKRDIQKNYAVELNKIFVAYLDIKSALKNGRLEALKSFPFKDYILCLGNVQPRKNFLNAVRALKLTRNADLGLVVVGKNQDEAEYKKIKDLIDSNGLTSRVLITGYTSDAELKWLFQHCKLFLFPSFYEGFGLPIIEAFASKVPVITSNVSCMPEVAGDAAMLIAPSSPKLIAEAIDTLLSNSKMKNELVAKGLKRLEFFENRSLAQETIEIYKKIMEQ